MVVRPESMDSNGVTIIVLCWNRWDLSSACLESIRRHTDLEDVEVLVVDNGSTDQTPEELAKLDWVRTIRNSDNLGFVRGNNVGIDAVERGRDVLLLNNDVEILEAGWIDRLRATAYAADDIGVVGCRLILPDGKLLHAGTQIFPETFWGQQIGSLETDVNQFAFDRDVQGIVFACAYLKRSTLDVLPGLSEDYQSYFEDTDYCLRAAEAGLRTVCCGSVTLLHREHGSTENEPGMFDQVFQDSRKQFERRWRPTLESRYDLDVHWQSVMNFAHGYAGTTRDILRELDGVGVRATYEYVYGRGTPNPHLEPENSGDYLLNVIRSRKIPERPNISVVYGQGDVFRKNRGRYRVGFTMLEVDGFPEDWVRQANEMDEVWTPSRANAEAMIHSGVRRPIVIMPLGVDTDRFHPGARGVERVDADFVFLANFEWGERKAPELLLRIFNATFRSSEPVVLVCKIGNRDPGVDIREAVDRLSLRPSGGRITFIQNREFPHHQLPMLYRSADCFVSAGHGEGWDMPLMEAMACGLPTIATDWGAHRDFIHEGVSFPLETLGTTRAIAKCPYYEGFSWADPNPDHLSALMREVYEAPERAAGRGQRAAAEVAERWSTKAVARRLRRRLREIGGESTAPGPSPSLLHERTEQPCVAIDLSRSVGEQVSGVGRYAANLATGLARYSPDDLRYLLLPGFGSFVHPDYGSEIRLEEPEGRNVSVYRGELPAFSSSTTAAPGVQLIHSTAHMAPKGCELPMLFTVHDLSFVTHPEFHTTENVKLCTDNLEYARAEGATFIAVSENTKSDLVRFGIPDDRIRVVYNSFDDRQLRPFTDVEVGTVRRKYELPAEYFLFLASLEPRKNLRTLLDAVRRHHPGGIPLVVAGGAGWHSDELRRELAEGRGDFLPIGYVPQEDLGRLYAGAQALVYPSIYEGFGLPLVEAMACGTPVIATRVSSMPEVVGDAGLLLDDPLDVDELAHAMRQIVEGDDQRKRHALEQASRFSMPAVTEALVRVYREALP